MTVEPPVTQMDDDLGPRTTLPTNDEADAAESSEDEDAVDWTKAPYVCITRHDIWPLTRSQKYCPGWPETCDSQARRKGV